MDRKRYKANEVMSDEDSYQIEPKNLLALSLFINLLHREGITEKEDLISEIKIERLFYTFRRLLQHYPMGSIKSYPGEVDSFMHLSIPVVRNRNDINGSVFLELYELDTPINSDIEL